MMPSFASISLLHPAMLAGLVWLAWPVVAHLVGQRAQRTVVFPALALLEASCVRQVHRMRLRRWLLLGIRLLILAALVLAFARPQWISAWADRPAHPGRAVVVLLDVSASTGQVVQGRCGDDRLRTSAQRVLDGLVPSRDQVNLVWVDDQPRPVFETFTTDPALADAQLHRVARTDRRADWPGALALGVGLLAQSDLPGELVVLSDFQATHWADALPTVPAKIKLTLRGLAEGGARGNVALHGARLEPGEPIAGQPALLRATAVNHSQQPWPIEVMADQDGQPLPAQHVTLLPGQSHDLTFETTLDAGWHRVSLTLQAGPDDALADDNQAFLAVHATARRAVAAVGTFGPGQAGYFLARALAPHVDPQANGYDVARLAPGQPLAGYRLVVIADGLSSWSAPSLKALKQYLEQGGSAIVFADAGPFARSLGKVTADWRWAWQLERQADAHLGQVNIAQPMLRGFDEPGPWALGKITLASTWRGRVTSTSSAEPVELVTFADGAPAMELLNVGAGRLAVARFGVDRSMGDLYQHGGFVALVQALAQGLSSVDGVAPPPPVGRGCALLLPGQMDRNQRLPTVFGPSGLPIAQGAVRFTPGGAQLHLPRTLEKGFYRASFGPADPLLGLAGVNLDPRESDLRAVDRQAIARRLQPGLAFVADGDRAEAAAVDVGAADGRAPSSNPIDSLPMWGYLVWLAMGLLAAETMLLGWGGAVR